MVGVTLKISTSDLTRIDKYLNKVPKKVLAAIRLAQGVEARLTIAKSQELVPVVTGLLKRSKFIGRSKTTGKTTTISIGYKVKDVRKGNKSVFDYAPPVEALRGYMKRANNSTRIGRKKRIQKFVSAALRN